MKKTILVILSALTIASCTKEVSTPDFKKSNTVFGSNSSLDTVKIRVFRPCDCQEPPLQADTFGLRQFCKEYNLITLTGKFKKR